MYNYEVKVVGIYDLTDEDSLLVLHTLQESLHQSLDGWGSYEQTIITDYLNDVAQAVAQTKVLTARLKK